MPNFARAAARRKAPGPEPAAAVASMFASYPLAVRDRLAALRQLILDTAAATPGVGRVDEALKWSQPSFLTTESGSGSTIRIDALKGQPAGYAIYFHCQTDLVETFRGLYPDRFHVVGNRAIHFDAAEELPTAELRHCIALALTYHARRSGRTG